LSEDLECALAQALEQHARSQERRAEVLPDAYACLRVMMDAYCRLKELGWNDAIYCPKDGSMFKAIEFGSTGIGDCSYDGDWPTGRWWMHEAHDLWPSRPVMYLKPYPSHPLPLKATEASSDVPPQEQASGDTDRG